MPPKLSVPVKPVKSTLLAVDEVVRPTVTAPEFPSIKTSSEVVGTA